MGMGNVSERRRQPPDVGVSVVMLALRPDDTDDGTDGGDGGPGTLWVLLVRRVREPFLGRWALPGGPLVRGCSLERSAYEALSCATDLRPEYLEQLHAFGDPRRSSSGLPMVSIVYWSLVRGVEDADFATAHNVRWCSVRDLPELAFDHRLILDHALERLRHGVGYPRIASKLIDERFTMAQLRRVVEAVTGETIDAANFRRSMLASGRLEDTGDKVSRGRQRPASLYRYRPGAEDPSDFPTARRDGDGDASPSGLPCADDAQRAMAPLMPSWNIDGGTRPQNRGMPCIGAASAA